MDCIVVSEERLASLSEFLNTKVTAESTNKYYEAELVRVAGDGKTGEAAIAAHYREAAMQRDDFYSSNLDSTEAYYKGKETRMEENLKHAIEQSETRCEARNREAEEHAIENTEKLDRMRENNAAFDKQMKDESELYNSEVKRISNDVHAKLKKVQGFLDTAAARRIPDEWLSGEWAYTPASTLMGSLPATPATPGTAGSMWSAPGATPSTAGASSSAGGPPRGLTGTEPSGDDEKALMNASLASSNYEILRIDEGLAGGDGTDAGSRPGTSQSGQRPTTADTEALQPSTASSTMMGAMFSKASNGADKLTHSDFEVMEIQLGRPPMGKEAWNSMCTGLGRDPSIGIDRSDFSAMYPDRLSQFDIPSTGPELEVQLRQITGELGMDMGHLFAQTEPLENTFPDTAMIESHEYGEGADLPPRTA